MRRKALGFVLCTLVATAACAGSSRNAGALPEGPPSQLTDTSAADATQSPPDTAAPEPTAPRPENVIYRAELQRATHGGKPGYLARELAPEAHVPRGAFQGWRIGHVFPDDPELCAPGCDLQPGDIILTVNGSPLERPEQLSQLVAEIDSLTELEVRLIRGGKLHERTYQIVDQAR